MCRLTGFFTLFVLATMFWPSDAFAHADAPRQRRVRYAGKYPKRFEEKHKEQAGDEATIARVLRKGGTPAGSHVPIMPTECLTHLGLIEGQTEITTAAPSTVDCTLVAVDCTLGFGGHSGLMLDALSRWVATSSAKSAVLASFDQDGIELAKTEARLRARPSFSSESAALSLDCIHANFATVGDAFALRQLPKAHALLADLGCSSMQIDDPARGFTWKTEGPLDMRMDITSSVTAAELLLRSNVTSLAALLHAHSDFDMADARALALAILDAPVPATTSALASKVRSVKPSVPVEEASPVEASGRPLDVRGPGGGKGGGGKGGGGKGGGKGGGGKGGVVGGRGGSLKGEMPRERDGGLRAVEHAKRLRALGTKRLLLELDEDDEAEARAAARASAGKPKPLSVEEAEKELNSRVARVMQALRVEVNAEFAALDSLLASLPSVLAPSGRAVFLTFHSGEDRRVKQAMKEGLKAGDYSEVSRRVVRVGSAEARANPRSKCCKLRWCVRAAD